MNHKKAILILANVLLLAGAVAVAALLSGRSEPDTPVESVSSPKARVEIPTLPAQEPANEPQNSAGPDSTAPDDVEVSEAEETRRLQKLERVLAAEEKFRAANGHGVYAGSRLGGYAPMPFGSSMFGPWTGDRTAVRE